MSGLFPYPLVSLALLSMWLLLSDSVAPGTLLLGAILGLCVPFSLKALEAEPLRIKKPSAVPKLAALVLYDVVRSNIAVATIILGRRRKRTSGFLHIPLDMKSVYGLAILATIVTCTPGTLWVQYDSGRGRLLIHVLDLVDEADWIHLIKGRYERLLMEIFE